MTRNLVIICLILPLFPLIEAAESVVPRIVVRKEKREVGIGYTNEPVKTVLEAIARAAGLQLRCAKEADGIMKDMIVSGNISGKNWGEIVTEVEAHINGDLSGHKKRVVIGIDRKNGRLNVSVRDFVLPRAKR